MGGTGGTGGWYGPSEYSRSRLSKQDGATLTQRGDGNYGGRWYLKAIRIGK